MGASERLLAAGKGYTEPKALDAIQASGRRQDLEAEKTAAIAKITP
jgi:hypothetical protein